MGASPDHENLQRALMWNLRLCDRPRAQDSRFWAKIGEGVPLSETLRCLRAIALRQLGSQSTPAKIAIAGWD